MASFGLWSSLGTGGLGLLLGWWLARAVFRSQAVAARAGESIALNRRNALHMETVRLEQVIRASESYRHEMERRYQAVLREYRRDMEDTREALLLYPDLAAVRDRLSRLGRIVSVVPSGGSPANR